jgi:carboxyl-terminal processing protease
MKNRSFKILAFSTLLFVGIGLWAFKPQDNAFEIAKNIDIFTTLYRELNTYYVDEVNPNKVMRIGIDAMLKSLDPYTNYYSEDQIEDYRTMTTGEYSGIGASVVSRGNKVLVTMPYENSPAMLAGLKIGDEILEIDGIKTNNKQNQDVTKLLKGQANTTVKLVVKHYGSKESQEISIKRGTIKVPNVPYFGMINAEVGYIQLTDFTQGATSEVKKALEDLKMKGAKNIILDLRGNPGGLLNEAVNICNIFINKDLEVVHTKGKIAEWNKVYKSLNMAVDTQIPLIVLANNRSASASEIVSGVIQDYDRGVLIGQRTFGKGLVQTTRMLSYNSQMKITTAKYYVPSGRCIQALDYSHKDIDGKASKIPDSLRRAFKTKAGRLVYDGAGLEPDLPIEREPLTPISQSLISKNLIFEYANEYASKHSKIKIAKEFELSDAEYQEFINWVKQKEYSYKTEAEKGLDNLIDASKKDKSYDAIQGEISALKGRISRSKEADLLTFKSEIREILESEISERFYFERGGIEATFDDDKEIQEALKLFRNTEKYKQILAKR